MRNLTRSCMLICLLSLLITPNWSRADIDQPTAPATPGIPITFTLPQDSFVTLVIDDTRGNRVRNLVAEKAMPAGQQTVSWDGLDDYGNAVAIGDYHWKGLYRGPIHQVYQMSAYDAGARVPWFTTAVQKGTDSGWLSDHNPTWSVAAVGDKIFAGAITSENGQDMMALDLDGKKLWGISHPYGVGAMEYAYDGKTVYAAGEGQWAGANAYIWTIDPTTYATKQIVHIPSFIGLRGLVAKGGKLYVSCEMKSEVMVIDIATGATDREIPLAHAGGIAMTPTGDIYAISGTSIVELTDQGAGRVIVADHLTRPNRMAIGADGTIYVTDGPTSWYPADSPEQNALYGTEDERFKGDNQVKEFDSTGKFLRAIGTPGGRHAGPWDPQAMRLPVGIAVDSQNHIWVAEWDLLPKRISVWNSDGTLYKEYIGAHKYGGGGTLDPLDRSTLIYDGNLMTLNWATAQADPVHSWKFDGTLAEIMPDTSDKPLPVIQNPTRMMHYQGHAFMVGGVGWNDLAGGLFYKWDGKYAKPCAYIGPSPVIPPTSYLYNRLVQCIGPQPPGFGGQDPGTIATPTYWGFCTVLMTWSDKNGDGKMDPDEVTFTRAPFFWLQDPVFSDDLTGYIRNEANRGVTSVWRIPMTGLNAEGSPVWDVNHITTVVDRVPNPDVGGGYGVTDTGRVIMSANPIYGIDPATHTTWTYHNDWPDTGGGAPKEKPGLVIASYNVRGVAAAGGEVGNIVAFNSDFGQWYLFTADGLFLSTLFGDTRTAPFWGSHFPEAKNGMLVDGVSLGQESFAGSLNKGSDGNVYIVAGHPHLSVIMLTGLDTVKRIGGTLAVTSTALDQADAAVRQAALTDRATNGAPKLTLWTVARASGSPFHPVLGTLLNDGVNTTMVWPRYDDKNLIIGTQVRHFLDTTEGAAPLSHGDAIVVDLSSDTDPALKDVAVAAHVRVIVSSVADKPRVTMYQYAGGNDAETKIVSTRVLDDADVKVELIKLDMGQEINVTATIPWADLHVNPPSQDGSDNYVIGDVGVVIADPYGGPSKRLQFGDVFATLGGSAGMRVDPSMFAKLTRQEKGQ